MREVVSGLSGDYGVLNVGDDSKQLLRPDAAELSVLVRLQSQNSLAKRILRSVDV